jgi:hypothetical protein
MPMFKVIVAQRTVEYYAKEFEADTEEAARTLARTDLDEHLSDGWENADGWSYEDSVCEEEEIADVERQIVDVDWERSS